MSNIDWHHRAGLIWPRLTEAARDGRKPSYGELAAVIPTSARAVRHALNPIRDFCLHPKNRLPPLTWIVVNWKGEAGSDVDARNDVELFAGREKVFSHDWDKTPNPFVGPGKPVAAESATETSPYFADTLIVVHPPSREELEDAWRNFDLDWGGVVDTLYRLCREDPADFSRRGTMAKVILINRAYNARLEAKVEPPQGRRAIEVIGEYLETHGEHVHDIVATIDGGAALTSEVLEVVVRQHGELTELLAADLTHGASMRSFISKYLHFHRPVVPIYDSQCKEALEGRVKGAVRAPRTEGLDRSYYEFCARFLALYQDCHSRGLAVTVKKLDALLWHLPKKS